MLNLTRRRDLLALAGAGFLPSLRGQQGPNTQAGAPDLVVLNARVITVEPGQPRAEAFAISNGRFLAVGTNAEVRNVIRQDKRQHLSLLGVNVTHWTATPNKPPARKTFVLMIAA